MLRTPIARRLLTRCPPGCSACIGRRTFVPQRLTKRSGRPVENLDVRRLSQESQDYQRNRRIFLVCGAVAGIVSFTLTAWKLKQELAKNPNKLDTSLPSNDPLATSDAASRKVVVHDEDGREVVPTGNSTVPSFPRTLEIPHYGPATKPTSDSTDMIPADAAAGSTEYTLVGFGVRTVSFLGFQVYVVGYYVATADIAALQSALVKKIDPIATTLVPGERDQLRTALLDPVQSEETWKELLQRGIPARSLFRVVPVRDTDFHHLRDGFVRAIQAKVPSTESAGDDNFGEAMRDFRAFFNRGTVPKRKELLLLRDGQGRLSVIYDYGDGKKKKDGRPGGRQLLGSVDDERISRALWLHYLGGKTVASEPARQNIVEGVMEFVERPVGTVASQVL